MAAKQCLVLYGNSGSSLGIKAVLECERALPLDVLTVDARASIESLFRARTPSAVLFDLDDLPGYSNPAAARAARPAVIGVGPSSNEVLVLTSLRVSALTAHDLVHVIPEASQLQENATIRSARTRGRK